MPIAKRPTLSKREANYRSTSSRTERCGTCSMYMRGGRCTLVRGEIDPKDTCDFWEAPTPLKVGGGPPGPLDDALADRILHHARLEQWDDLARELVQPLGEAAAQGVLDGFGALDTEVDDDAFRLANEDAVQYAAERAAELVGRRRVGDTLELVHNAPPWAITDSTRESLRGVVTQAVSEGWSPQRLQEAVLESGIYDADRAETIARTELAIAHSAGTLAAWRRSEVVSGKRWLLSNLHDLDDVCDMNAAAGVIPLDASFPSGDDGPPAHPNCECVVVADVAEPTEGDVRGARRALIGKYSPEQPRDYHGRWTEGGGAAPADVEPGAEREQLAWQRGVKERWAEQQRHRREAELARRHPKPGVITDANAPGWIGHEVPSEEVPTQLRNRAAKIAARDGWEAGAIQYVDKAPVVQMGGRMALALGTYDTATRRINVYLDSPSNDETLTHEGWHLRHDVVDRQAKAERAAAQAAGDVTEEPTRDKWGSSVLRPWRPLKPGVPESKYPAYAVYSRAFGSTESGAAILNEDGVSKYSASVWQGTDDTHLAVAETLAEHARLQAYPRSRKRALEPNKPRPHLMALYDGIKRQYERLRAEGLHKYSPDQPRDDHGRWSEIGAGGAIGAVRENQLVARLSQPDGGFSVSRRFRAPAGGYMVSAYPERGQAMPMSRVSAPVLARYLKDNEDVLREPGRYFGGWHDPKTDKVWLDISVHKKSAAAAEQVARAKGQLAYFDMTAGKSVSLSQEARHGKARQDQGRTGGVRGADHGGAGARTGPRADGAGAHGRGDGGGARDPALKYSPEQPRDYHGRWTEGGAGVGAPEEEEPKPTAEEPPSKPPKRGSKAAEQARVNKKWQEQNTQEAITLAELAAANPQPGVLTDREAPGWIGHVVPDDQVPSEVKARAERVAKRDGWDPAAVQYVDKAPIVMIGNSGGEALGMYHRPTKRIMLYLDTPMTEQTLTHEGWHLRQHVVDLAADREREEAGKRGDLMEPDILHDPRTGAPYTMPYARLRAGVPEDRYPNYSLMARAYATAEGRAALQKEDGITQYSASTWHDQGNATRSVDETLAEMARLEAYPHARDRPRGLHEHPHLDDLYQGIKRQYVALTGGKRP